MTDTHDETAELTFPAGIPGFPELQRFRLEPWTDEADSPYAVMVAVDNPDVRFLVAAPETFFPDYDVEIGPAEAEALELKDASEAAMLVFITVPERPEDATANVLAPIVVNTRTRMAAQIILDEATYTTKRPLVSA